MYNVISPISLHRGVTSLFLAFVLCSFAFSFCYFYWDSHRNKLANLQMDEQHCLDKQMVFAHIVDSIGHNPTELSESLFSYPLNLYKDLVDKATTQLDEVRKEKIATQEKVVNAGFATFISAVFGLFFLFSCFLINRKFTLLYSRCQSCGRTIDPALMNYGTEIDRSLSRSFCNTCYGDGKFLHPDINVDGMKELVVIEMLKRGFLTDKIEEATKRIEKLKRWKYYNEY